MGRLLKDETLLGLETFEDRLCRISVRKARRAPRCPGESIIRLGG